MKLKDNPTLNRQGQLQHFLGKIKNKNLFGEKTYKKIYPCGSKPATIYSFPKTYKKLFDSNDFDQLFLPQALIITFLLNFPKQHCAKDSFSFYEEIQQVSSKDNFLVSYDVCSLFTIIPLQETIEIAVELLLKIIHN